MAYTRAGEGAAAGPGSLNLEREADFGRSLCSRVRRRLKAGVQGGIECGPVSSSHCFAKVMSESDKHPHIHLNLTLFLSGIVGKKIAAQAESCIIDERST
jgi:hypothetical protein